jgi:hypothetical protein
MRIITFITLASSVLLMSCQEKQEPTATPAVSANSSTIQTPPKKIDALPQGQSVNKQQWQIGTVQFFNLEGGFYGIVTTDGNHVLPMNLPKEYRIPGTKIKFTGEVLDVMTIQQWGKPTKLLDIELITLGNSNENTSESDR